jgi:hypothetical protein
MSHGEATVWRLDTAEAFWERMHQHLSEAKIVDHACAIGRTHGRHTFLRPLNIGHHQVVAGEPA